MMIHKHVVLALALLIPFGCAGRKAVWKDGDGGQDGASAASDTAALVAKGDEHWAKRTDPAAIRAALVEWEKAAAAEPKNMEVGSGAPVKKGYKYRVTWPSDNGAGNGSGEILP